MGWRTTLKGQKHRAKKQPPGLECLQMPKRRLGVAPRRRPSDAAAPRGQRPQHEAQVAREPRPEAAPLVSKEVGTNAGYGVVARRPLEVEAEAHPSVTEAPPGRMRS